MNLDIDDPRLTAFALGELPEAERPDIEQALADQPDLAREIEQIRLTARWLSEQLHEEQSREAVAAAPPLRLAADTPGKRRFWRRHPWMSAAALVMLGTSTALLMPAIRSAREARLAGHGEPSALDFEGDKPVAIALAPAASSPAESLRNQLAGTGPGADAPTDSRAYTYHGERDLSSPAAGRLHDPARPEGSGRISTMNGAPALVRMKQNPQEPSLDLFATAAAPATPAVEKFGSDRFARVGPEVGPRGERRIAGQEDLERLYEHSPGRGRGQTDENRAIGIMGMMNPPDGMNPGMEGMASASGGMIAGPASARPSQKGEGESRQFASRLGDQAQAGQVDSSSIVPQDAKAPAEFALASAPPSPNTKQKAEGREEEEEAAALAFSKKPGDLYGDEVARNGAQPEALVEGESRDGQAAPEPLAQAAPAPAAVEENPFILTSQEAASTFAIDVDTASYSIVRRSLMEQNRLPNPDEVRIEEMLNYFPYQDAPPPADGPAPFSIHVEPARCPWNAANRLARIGIMGRPLGQEARKPSNLVFLVDVSGSMDQPNKLPLVQWALQKLVEQLGENDRVAVAVYAGSSGLVLPSTSAMNKPAILSKIEELRAGGSTNGGAGIQLAYDQAAAGFINGGINRVILATDGDFNVGVTNQDELVRLVESRAKGEKPIFLTVLGFGMDNLKDGTLEKLADKGNGHYAYIDRPEEAYKVLVEEMGATLDVIAKDVKIQVEFKPEMVRAYRLVGYENRVMPNQDFRDDRKDGGEIGAGHHVTALYEYVPAEVAPAPPADGGPSPASFTVRLRYKQPEGEVATEIERPVVDRGADYADASDDFKFASAAAGFGMILRHSPSVGSLTLPGVIELASPTLAHDPGGYRREFMGLVQRARDIQNPPLAAPTNP